jgi:hypothetical protein
MNKRFKHVVPSETFSPIEAETVFIQVHLQILGANIVVDATNPVLRQAPETLYRVRVSIARDIDALTVMDALVLIAAPFKWIVGDIFVREDDALGQYSLPDMRNERCGLSIRNDLRHDSAASFNETEYRCFASPAGSRVLPFAAMLVLFQAAIETFVRFNLARQWSVFVEHRANLVKHAPSTFVGNTKLAFQLLGPDSASRGRHDVDRIEPEFQGRCRILKDSAAHRMFVVAAILASVGWPLRLAVVLGYFLAGRAMNAFWIEPFNQPFETSRVVREIPLKFHQRISAVGDARTYRHVAINLAHTANRGISGYCRQGDTYPT